MRLAMQSLLLSLCLLLPALVPAIPWVGPVPTLLVPEPDNWSPAPTRAPHILDDAIELLKRDVIGSNTCGFVSADKVSSLTCRRSDYVCATDSAHQVHGCCDPSSLVDCIMFTTCIPYTSLSSYTDSSFVSDPYIARCTNAAAPECYNWLYVYPGATTMTEYGCAALAFTSSVSRIYSDFSGDTSVDAKVTTRASGNPTTRASVTSPIASMGAPQPPKPPPSSKSVPIGAIVGASVGGLAVIGGIAFGTIFFCCRRKKKPTAKNPADPLLPDMSSNPNAADPQHSFPGYTGYYAPHGDPKYGYPPGHPGTEQRRDSSCASALPLYSQQVLQEAPSVPCPVEAGGNPIHDPAGVVQLRNAEGQPIYEAP